MKKSSNKIKITLISILVIGVVIALMVIWMYLVSQPTVVLSCKNKQFIGFSNSQMPIEVYPEPNACNGFVEVRTLESDLICEESSYTRTDQEKIKVPCIGLKGKKGETIRIKFETYSDLYGNSTGEITTIYK